jgi:hypothetical protein
MIDAEIYGPTPSITIESDDSPPPENTFSKLKKSDPASRLSIRNVSTPGTGIIARSLVTIRIVEAKNILLLMLSSVKISLSFSKNLDIFDFMNS